MFQLPLNTSFKSHLLLASGIALWLVLFLIIIGPFDIATLPLINRIELMPPYGLIFLGSYLAVVPLQNFLYRNLERWNILLELLVIFLIYLLCLFFVFQYYTSDLVKGEFSFQQFTAGVYLPVLLIVTTILIFGRWFIARKQPAPSSPGSGKLELRGDNRSDVLRIDMAQLVCMSSAQNYVEVFYLHDQQLKKHLLRTTLKKMQQDTPRLIRIHRSHLINPAHLVRWSGTNTITVHQLELPVSQQFKKDLLESLQQTENPDT